MPVFLKRTRASPAVMLRRFDAFPKARVLARDDDRRVAAPAGSRNSLKASLSNFPVPDRFVSQTADSWRAGPPGLESSQNGAASHFRCTCSEWHSLH